MNIAIIPARLGSKRIPRKNIKNFFDRPIIEYPIEQALKSGIFDNVFVSTDSKEIAIIAENVGAEIPFLRPSELSDDLTSTQQVISHAVQSIDKRIKFSNVCCMYPTSVFFNSEDLIKSYAYFQTHSSNYVFSATKISSNILRGFTVEDESVKLLFENNINKRTQDLKSVYQDAAQFYWGKRSTWLNNKEIINNVACPYILESKLITDIDEDEDWQLAELYFNSRNRNV